MHNANVNYACFKFHHVCYMLLNDLKKYFFAKKHVFIFSACHKIIENIDINLFFSMHPLTLLLKGIYSYLLAKTSIIHCLLLDWNQISILIFFHYFIIKNDIIVLYKKEIEIWYMIYLVIFLHKEYIFTTFTFDDRLFIGIVVCIYIQMISTWNNYFEINESFRNYESTSKIHQITKIYLVWKMLVSVLQNISKNIDF